jgi:hypothetical protein
MQKLYFCQKVSTCAIAENKPVFTSDLRKVKTPPLLDLDINGTIADLL